MDQNAKTISPEPYLRQSLTGRIRNFNLPPTAENCLMPLYEAISNALYAIQEKFPEKWPDQGVITIEVIRDDVDDSNKGPTPRHGAVTGFIISDNGIGLTDDLFLHFQELDTEYRADKNGRGIGRLSWLKVFKNVDLISIFSRSKDRVQREFRFRLSNTNAFDNYSEAAQNDKVRTGTIVNLLDYRDDYAAKSPRNPKDIQDRILAHFIALFAQPKRLKINLVDEGKTNNLSDLFFDSIVGDKDRQNIEVSEGVKAEILHLLLPKKLAPIGNSIIYCASDRSVLQKDISEVIGLKNLPSNEHGSLIYIGLVSGEVFDNAHNHERTAFHFGDIDFDKVNKLFVDSAKSFLSPYLGERRKKNRALLTNLLNGNPLYSSVVGDIDEYVETMPLNWDETKLVQDIALKRHRAKNALFKQIDKLELNAEKMSDESFAEEVDRITKELGETEKSSLAQYVVERRMVIQLLQNRRRKNPETGKYQAESDVHEVICPLGVTSDVMDYEDHNLWLIDDRLAYYSFIASDRPTRTYAKDSEQPSDEEVDRRKELSEIKGYSEAGEPDLAIFQYPMLFRRTGTPDPVVIVEFKAPNKTSYTGATGDNPVLQIRKYIETLQAKTCHDFEGDRITDITKDTPFHCFLIAEPSEKLFFLLRGHGIYRPTPEGGGRFGYFEDLNAYFEFIPYDQVVRNAALRNEAFFRKLGLPSVKGVTA